MSPGSRLLEDPISWRRRPVHVAPEAGWSFVGARPPGIEAQIAPHHGRPIWTADGRLGGAAVGYRIGRTHDDLPAGAGAQLRGNACAVFVFDPFHLEARPGSVLREEIREHFVPIQATVLVGLDDFHSADVVLATKLGVSAYPVSGLPGCLVKAYLVQDFEPSFYPISAEYLWAKETYRMGLERITFTPWLAETVRRESGSTPAEFTYGTDLETYPFAPLEEREPGPRRRVRTERDTAARRRARARRPSSPCRSPPRHPSRAVRIGSARDRAVSL